MSETKPIIFLDLDMTIVDTGKGVCEFLEVPYIYDNPENLGIYKKHKLLDMEWEDLWLPLPQELWANLPIMPWADDLVELILSYEPDVKLRFLTSPIQTPECYAGKFEWIEKHYPALVNRTIVGWGKPDIVGHDDLLIDDSPKNNKKFADKKKSRSFLYFPAVSNHLYMDVPDTEEKKNRLFRKIRSNIEDKILKVNQRV